MIIASSAGVKPRRTLESALGWTVAWEPADRDFIGREAIEKQREDKNRKKLIGLVLQDRGVLRNHQKAR